MARQWCDNIGELVLMKMARRWKSSDSGGDMIMEVVVTKMEMAMVVGEGGGDATV